VIDHIEPLDLVLGPHQLVEMPTATTLIPTEMNDEVTEVQLHATTVSGLSLLAREVEVHQVLSPQLIVVAMSLAIAHHHEV
jgi:hypothetical protein